MAFYLTEPETEDTVGSRHIIVYSRLWLTFSKPSRGPKLAGVLSAKYTDDETGLVMCQLRPYAAGMLKDLLPKNGS